VENIAPCSYRNDFKDDPLRRLVPVHLKDNAAPYYIAGILREAIFRGVLLEGEALYQNQLAARLSVSPIPLREALRLLEMEGLVDFNERRGAIVTGLRAEEVRDIYEMLAFAEIGLMRIAFPLITPDLVEAADRLLDEMDAQTDDTAWREANLLFHNSFYEPTGRLLTLDSLTRLRRQVDRYIRVHVKPMWEDSQKQHRLILEAIRAKNLSAVIQALAFHLENTSENLQFHMKTRPLTKPAERGASFSSGSLRSR
jgi:DNA-binding GntR family transcriptional regulator